MNQYWILVNSKFLGLISVIPIEVFITFRLSDNSSFYGLFGASLIIPLLLELVLQPYISALVDGRSRRKLLICNSISNIASVGFASFILLPLLGRPAAIYSLILVSIELYFFFFFQAYNALAQETLRREQYGRFNGISEITGQLPSLVGGIFAGIILLGMGFDAVVLSEILFQVFSIGLLLHLREGPAENAIAGSHAAGLGYRDSLSFMRRNFRQIMVVFLLNFPFLAIVSGNFLKPIFIASTLHGSPSWLAASEVAYASFAIIAGLFTPRLNERIGYMKSIYILAGIFFAGSLLMPFFPQFTFYLAFQALHGIGNPGVRIGRNTLIMKTVARRDIGRFYGSVNLLTVLGRIILLVVCILEVGILGPGMILLGIGVVVLGAIIAAGFLVSKYPLLIPSEAAYSAQGSL